MIRHDLAWTAPQPFWTAPAGNVAPRGELAQPQILRFATDDFMPQLLSQLEQDPASLPDFVARPETWRGPATAPVAEPQRWLQREPRRFLGLRRAAQRRGRAGAAAAPAPAQAPTLAPLKLYQPAHLRHYLVAGALVCRTPGLPDRQVDPARQKVSFVVRRLLPPPPPAQQPADPAQWQEHAFLPQGKTSGWCKVPLDPVEGAAVLLPGEERLAMFPSQFIQDDGHPRRLYVGSVPVGRRETYQAAPLAPAATDAQEGGGEAARAMDPRLALFHSQVLAPWRAMVNQVMRQTLGGSHADARPDFLFDLDEDFVVVGRPNDLGANAREGLRAARGALQTASWYLLLDLHHFLTRHVAANFLQARPGGAAGRLYDALNQCALTLDPTGAAIRLEDTPASVVQPNSVYDTTDVEINLVAALRRVDQAFEDLLEAAPAPLPFELPTSGGKPADWPGFLFLFADPWFGVLQPPSPAGFVPQPGDYLAEHVQARIGTLATLVDDALREAAAPAGPLPEPPLASVTPIDMREAWYVMRLVYERPDCAPFEGTVVSAATQPFQMAGFFDPDAPARPIRIGLPLDISPAGLRKFDKNTAFMLSDVLCGHLDRVKGITLADLVLSVLPWPFHKDLKAPSKGDCKQGDLSLGVMCSLSIPIVTICALLLLMIIVSILDYFFRWMPYFIACFPLPGFKGRKEEP